MKKIMLAACCCGIVIFISGCGTQAPKTPEQEESEITFVTPITFDDAYLTENSEEDKRSTSHEAEANLPEKNHTDATTEMPDDAVYIGEYLDSDVGEPNLEIAKGEDGTYIVQIGIYRLTEISDGVGELTPEGMNFTATDAAGNPISGVITVEDKTANVIFTNSTWTYLENGSAFQYTKSSDSPNLW